MDKFENWYRVTKGMYRYAISVSCAYEIVILYWEHKTSILTAKANLYIVGEWNGLPERACSSYLERECLMSERPIFECVEQAVKDFKENCS